MKQLFITIIITSLFACNQSSEGCIKIEYNGDGKLDKLVYIIRSEKSNCSEYEFLTEYPEHQVIEIVISGAEYHKVAKITLDRYVSLKDEKFKGTSGYLTVVLDDVNNSGQGYYEFSYTSFLNFIEELNSVTTNELSMIQVSQRDFYPR